MSAYSLPQIYDIAFGFRDVPAQVDVVLGWAERAAGHPSASVLELACGPAAHAIEAARRGLEAAGLDLAPEMCDYARSRAERAGANLAVYQANMTAFDLGSQPRFDLAVCLIDSLSHVLSLDDMIAHLRCVRRHLRPGGVYIAEQTHPKDHLGQDRSTLQQWTEHRGGIAVTTRWGRPEDPFDPVALVRTVSVEMRVEQAGAPTAVVRSRIPLRTWFATEMEAAVRLSQAFEMVARHGDFALDAPFDTRPASWRMISVLRAA